MPKLIENQNNIPKERYRYGFRSSAATGCGWIATYNALAMLGYTVEPEDLIRYYEWQLPLIHGNLGTSFWAPAVCFRKWGFPAEVILDRKRFDQAGKEADVCVLFYHWRKGLKLGAHFVALHHTERGFVGYNTYRNSAGPDFYGDSLEAFLKKQGYYGAVLIAIRNKKAPLPERQTIEK